MKLSKLNGILIIFSLGMSSALDSTNDVPKNHPTQEADAFSANDMYLDKNPNKDIKKQESHFVETKAQIKEKAPKPSIKEKRKVATIKNPTQNLDPKLVIIGNPKLKDDPKLSTYTKCGKRTGYLSMVKNPELIPKELRIIKIFANLSLNSLLLFMTTNPNSLFNSIKLNNILRISQQKTLQKFNCFDIVLNEVKPNTLNKGPLTFCTKNNQEMNEWISTILEFKECKINVANVNKQSQVVVDFAKVNQLLTSSANQIKVPRTLGSKDSIRQAKQAEKMKPLYYQNIRNINENTYKSMKEYEIARHFKTILKEIQESNIQSKQLQRQMIDKLQRARKFTKEIQRKGEMIKQLVQQRQEQDQERKTGLIQRAHKNKEIKLLKEVQTKIINIKKQEYQEFKKNFVKEIKKEKAKANEEARNMMEIIIEETKLRPYNDCINPRLKKFEDMEYVHGLCKRFYGEAGEVICQKKNKFCDMCCSHHIGVKYSDKLQECQQTCSDVVKHGIEPIRVEKKKVTVKPK